MKLFRALPFLSYPKTVIPGVFKQTLLQVLSKYQYYNIHLAVMLVLSYGSFSVILNFPFSSEYALLCFFGILCAYGLDNYKDFESDLNSWKLKYIHPQPGKKQKTKIFIFQVCYPVILLSIMALDVLKTNVYLLIIPACLALLHNFSFSLWGFKIGLKHIPFAKPIGISFGFIYLALLLPSWRHSHFISDETLKLSFYALPFFIAGIILCDYRDQHLDNQTGIFYGYTKLPIGKFKSGFGIIWLLFILALSGWAPFLPGPALILSGGYGLGTLFLSSCLTTGLFQDLLLDSLAGVPFFIALIAC